ENPPVRRNGRHQRRWRRPRARASPQDHQDGAPAQGQEALRQGHPAVPRLRPRRRLRPLKVRARSIARDSHLRPLAHDFPVPLTVSLSDLSAVETVVPARGKALVATDLSIAIPEGTYARIAPRSGLALKHAIDAGAGVIDADYRGPVGVVLFNHSEVDFVVKPGDRVAQMIIQVIATPEVAEVEDLDATVRGEGGFGSTGV
uniref:Deoxyuridine 5'-triphosphate nucleotidohydrolase n=1 Tax=Aegilops tauschii subsp. strangulata TaxID=200361 RepID=A0A453H1T0_AEGTS